MMRSVLLALMFSGSVFALSATAYAQASPDTRQTDQSEEDWRKSKKKGGTTTEDILDIIENTRNSGVGNGRGYSPIDALPEESRRHLMKERAKRMAQAGPNEPVDMTYKPSEAAKSDSDLQDDEKAAWEKMAQGMNGAPDQGLPGQQGQQDQGQQGQQGSQGQSGQQGQQGQQGGGQSSNQSGQSNQSRSVMRGGSAASVSDIMARIKGLSPSGGGAGQAPQGQSGQGQSQQSKGSQGQSQQQAQNQGQSQTESQSQQDGQQDSNSQSDAQADAAAKSEALAEAASKAHSIANSQDASQAPSSTRVPEAISPLDRIKKANREQNNSGSRSSASDYLKKKE